MDTAALSLRLFGVPTWTGPAGQRLVFAAERPFQLLAYLACRGAWVSRDELAEWMWPEREQRVARSNLRKVLLLAQRIAVLPPPEQQGGRLQWSPDSDLRRFERACDEQQAELALSVYRPPLLQGMEAGMSPAAMEWLGFERQRIAARWRVAATQALARVSGDPAATARLCEALLQQEPLADDFTLALASAWLVLEQPARAAQVLEAHAQRLASELQLVPSAPLRALAGSLRGHPAAGSRPGKAAPLVGRRAEQQQLQALLARDTCRALTLTGPGGIGKSSLARAAIAAFPPAIAERACWVALADLDGVSQLPSRLASAVSLVLTGGADAWEQIARHIGEQTRLLVLDNAEHLELPPLATALSQLLAACPGLKLLLTSRTRLNFAGEWLLPLEGLPLPDADEADPDLLRRCDSVQLFEERALAASPTFSLAAQSADVVRLVHAVEGLPLALELAAAWVRLLPAKDIADELERSVDLLDAGPAPSRDRSLRASFARSWALLSPLERGCLVELAQLPAAFGREMAQQVARTPLPVLAALADKSLVRTEGPGRFSLHLLIRQCAVEAAEPGEAQALAARHAAYTGCWLSRHGDPRVTQLKQAPPRSSESCHTPARPGSGRSSMARRTWSSSPRWRC